MKLIIVEKQSFNQLMIEQTLKDTNYRFVFVENPSQVVNELSTGKKADAVLFNIDNPGKETPQICQKIKREMPGVLMVAIASDTEKIQQAKTGFDSMLSTGFSPEELDEVLKNKPSLDSQNSDKTKRLYDLKHLEEFAGGDSSFINEMLSFFVNDAPQTIAELQDDFEHERWKEVEDKAHRFIPQLSFMGLKQLVENIKTVEIYATKQNKRQNIPKLLQELKQGCDDVVIQLKTDFEICQS